LPLAFVVVADGPPGLVRVIVTLASGVSPASYEPFVFASTYVVLAHWLQTRAELGIGRGSIF
jgi:hypothetical protein